MRKLFLGLLVTTIVVFPVLAREDYLRDVPEGHFAYDAVYDLIKLGVTGGYPDGTFRGKKLMNRYEIASFISKLARSFNVKHGSEEKLIAELQAELALFADQRQQAEKETVVSGKLLSRYYRGEAGSLRGCQMDYRFRLGVVRNFGESAFLKLNFDSLDSGFSGMARDLPQAMLDFEGKIKAGNSCLKITAGPGDVVHLDNGYFPLENQKVFRQPKRTISFYTNSGKTEFLLEHITRSNDSSGLINIAEVSVKLGQKISALKLTANPRYFYNTVGDRDLRLDLSAEINSGKGPSFLILLGAGKTADWPQGLYAKSEISWGDTAKILFQKIGSQHRELFSYGIYDLFDRTLANGATNYGLELKIPFIRMLQIKVKASRTDPAGTVSTEWKLGSRQEAAVNPEIFYATQDSARTFGLLMEVKI